MLHVARGLVARVFISTSRVLWTGALPSKLGALLGIAVVGVVLPSMTGPVLEQLLPLVLITACFIAIYGFLLRGR